MNLNLYGSILFSALVCLGNILCRGAIAEESLAFLMPAKKYNLSVGAVFKNEAQYLKEWIEYHQLIGVDHFYLYNNNSTDQYKKILDPYIKKGLVTLIYWPDCLKEREGESFKWALSTQAPAYEHAIKLKGSETKWLLFLDVDEFLVPSEGRKLHELLEKYDRYPGLVLTEDYFNASRIESLPRKKLLIETVELTQPPMHNRFKAVTKTIFKPDLCEGFIWPPYTVCFKEGHAGIQLKKQELRINGYVNRYKGALHFGTVKRKIGIDNRTLSENEVSSLLEEGYEIEDQEQAIFHFIPELLKKMGYAS